MPTNAKSKKRKKRTWDDIAREAQEYRDGSIDRVRPSLPQNSSSVSKNVMDLPETVLDPFEIKITQVLPEDLVLLLANGEVTAKAVANAFIRRAAVAQRLVRTPILMLPHSVLSSLSHQVKPPS
jgi:amidase